MSHFETTYGEIIDTSKLYSIINTYIKNTFSYNFYDFGSGYGKIVIEYHNKFIKCCGIELLKERHIIAINNNKHPNVYFINDNFFNFPLEKQYVLLINNLCLGEGTQKRLGLKILNTPKNNNLILVTKKIKPLEKYYINFYLLECSWGFSEVYVYMY